MEGGKWELDGKYDEEKEEEKEEKKTRKKTNAQVPFAPYSTCCSSNTPSPFVQQQADTA